MPYSERGRVIPFPEARKLIGRINPGFGYWWERNSNGELQLWLPLHYRAINLFVPLFVLFSFGGFCLAYRLNLFR